MANSFLVSTALEDNDRYLSCGLVARQVYQAMIRHADDEGRAQASARSWKRKAALFDKAEVPVADVEAAIQELADEGLVVFYGDGLLFLPGRFEHNAGRLYWAASTHPLPPAELLEQHPEYLDGLRRLTRCGHLRRETPAAPRYPELVANEREGPRPKGDEERPGANNCEEVRTTANDCEQQRPTGTGVGVGSSSSECLPPVLSSHFKKEEERAGARATPPPAAPAPPPPSRAAALPGGRKPTKPATAKQLATIGEMLAERNIDPDDGKPRFTRAGRKLTWPPTAATAPLWMEFLRGAPKWADIPHQGHEALDLDDADDAVRDLVTSVGDALDSKRSTHETAVDALSERLPKLRPSQIAPEIEAAPTPVRRAVMARLADQLEIEAGDVGTSLHDLVLEARGIETADLISQEVPFPVFGPGDVSRVHQLLQQRRQGVSQDAYA